jgi:hypothetical protein
MDEKTLPRARMLLPSRVNDFNLYLTILGHFKGTTAASNLLAVSALLMPT